MKLPVSYHQQRMWFIDHFERDYLYEGGPVYHNIPLCFTVHENVSIPILQNAFKQLVNRHAILRTKIVRKGDQIFQVITEPDDATIFKLFKEISDVKEHQEELRKVSFDFENELLLKGFYEQKENQTTVLFVMHHTLVDRYSLRILKEDFLSYVNAPEDTLGFTMQYKDFSEWQQAIDPYETELQVAYWRKQLSDIQVLYLPEDVKRVPVHIYETATRVFSYDKDTLQSFAALEGTTVHMASLAAYKKALAKFSELSDIVIGTLMNMRNNLTETTVGPIENLVVLRSVIENEMTLSEACTVVKNTWETAEKNKGIPFDKLVVEINPQKDMSRTALFDVLYLYDDYNVVVEGENLPGHHKNQGLGKYDLNLLVQEKEDTYEFILTYNDLYFESDTIASFLQILEDILNTATQHQDAGALRGIAVF
ncbi:condensation domain-containing protein [uncultured Dokdonia sp.]|uniref:condensation domain-containing protein n=1 Tax=uncultured Dokdonia sp. TaxID=575653 RepID=UPI00261DE5F3|nr:condensation domain-containing protein [uncultured Dokdonia sp.]